MSFNFAEFSYSLPSDTAYTVLTLPTPYWLCLQFTYTLLTLLEICLIFLHFVDLTYILLTILDVAYIFLTLPVLCS